MVSFSVFLRSAVRGGGRGAPRSAPLASRSARTAARAQPEPPRARGGLEKKLFLREIITCRSGGAEGCSGIAPTESAGHLAGHAPMRAAPEPQGSWKIFHQNFQGKYLIPLKMSACFLFHSARQIEYGKWKRY